MSANVNAETTLVLAAPQTLKRKLSQAEALAAIDKAIKTMDLSEFVAEFVAEALRRSEEGVNVEVKRAAPTKRLPRARRLTAGAPVEHVRCRMEDVGVGE